MKKFLQSKPVLTAGLALLVAALLGAYPLSAQSRYYTVDSFHSEIAVDTDGSITVEETLEVNFHHQRHGIFREIPYKYRDASGDMIRTPLEVISVKDKSGKSWEYRVRHEGNVVNIRIGDADLYVEGYQVYIIKYRVERVLLFLKDHDELYWNVTGNYWDASIKKASCNITLMTDKEIDNPRTACYSGKYGDTRANCTTTLNDRGAAFECLISLAAGEGFTVAYGWDKNIVAAPSDFENFLYTINLRENWIFIFPFISLFSMIWLYFKRGRDPRVQEAIVVQYNPPKYGEKELTAAEVGTMIDESMDPRDITGTLIGLAVKGYIKLVEEKSEGFLPIFSSLDYRLLKLKESDTELNSYERFLLESVFPGSIKEIMLSGLKNKFYKYIPGLNERLFDSMKEKKYMAVKPGTVIAKYIGLAFIILIAGIMISVAAFQDFAAKGIAATILTAIWPALFAKAMPVKTRDGARIRMQALGFREFMMKADKDRLERMGKDIFYKYMPYAIALDVVDHWAEAFEGIFGEPPQWYVSSRGFHHFSPRAFSQNINTATSSLASTMYSAPRGSGTGGRGGGGGGGFSGGGSGGGGGGSW